MPLSGVVDDAVIHRIVGVDFPAKRLRVELLELLAVLTGDLEVHYRVRHAFLLLRRAYRLNYTLIWRNLCADPFRRSDPTATAEGTQPW